MLAALPLLTAALAAGCTSTTSGSGRHSGGRAGPPTSRPASPPGSTSIDASNPYTRPELPAAKAIPGVVYHPEPDHTHQPGVLHYDTTPPTGGDHSQYWADCTGTVYPQPIANENAVHMLEHGAVWITYRQGLSAAAIAPLTRLVEGVDYSALSPYPDLRTAVSVQAWGYQMFVDHPTDPRIAQLLRVLRLNPAITPEYGAPCSQPSFKIHPSTFGHPLWVPAS